MNKTLLICLYIILLIGIGIIGLTSFSSQAEAPAGAIIIEGADCVANRTTEYSADLRNMTKNVTSRMVVDYGDSIFQLDLCKSDDPIPNVGSRIIVEYADSIFEHILESVTVPDIPPRIIVEYADSIFGPKPMEDNTPPVIENVHQQPTSDSVYPDDKVVVYANVTDYLSGVKQVILNYTTDNGTRYSVEMTNFEDAVYNATIPEFPHCTNVTYVILAEDNANNTITTEGMGYEYRYHVIPEFSSFIIVPLLMIATLLVVVIYRKKHSLAAIS